MLELTSVYTKYVHDKPVVTIFHSEEKKQEHIDSVAGKK